MQSINNDGQGSNPSKNSFSENLNSATPTGWHVAETVPIIDLTDAEDKFPKWLITQYVDLTK